MGTVNAFESRYHGCRKEHIITDADSGETFCSACGLVFLEMPQSLSQLVQPDSGRHSNYPINGTKSTHTRNDMERCTIIDNTNKDASGKPFGHEMMLTMGRMRKLDRRIIYNAGVNGTFTMAFARIDKFKNSLALSDAVAEMAAHIYRKAWKSGVVKRRLATAYIAAALCIACKYTSTLRTMKEISKAANINLKTFQKAYNQLVLDMDMKVPQIDITQCVSRIANNADISEMTKRHAIDIINKTMGHNDLVGRKPMPLAAAALYLSCVKTGEEKPWEDIADAAGCGRTSKMVCILSGLINN